MPLELNFREYGDGDAVILLLHGLFGSSANWGSVARQLAARYKVLVPDLRNHGQSPHAADVSYAAMAGDLLALLDHHNLDRALFVGHSMGGKVAMRLALHAPHRVLGLAVVDMAPVAYTHRFDQVFEAFASVDLSGLQSRADADAPMARVLPDPGVRTFLQQNLFRDAKGWHWRCSLEALREGQGRSTAFDVDAGARYTGPASFIYGTASDYLLPQHEPQVQRFFPAARLCAVQGAGHWVYAEQPTAFMDCLQQFLRAAR